MMQVTELQAQSLGQILVSRARTGTLKELVTDFYGDEQVSGQVSSMRSDRGEWRLSVAVPGGTSDIICHRNEQGDYFLSGEDRSRDWTVGRSIMPNARLGQFAHKVLPVMFTQYTSKTNVPLENRLQTLMERMDCRVYEHEVQDERVGVYVELRDGGGMLEAGCHVHVDRGDWDWNNCIEQDGQVVPTNFGVISTMCARANAIQDYLFLEPTKGQMMGRDAFLSDVSDNFAHLDEEDFCEALGQEIRLWNEALQSAAVLNEVGIGQDDYMVAFDLCLHAEYENAPDLKPAFIEQMEGKVVNCRFVEHGDKRLAKESIWAERTESTVGRAVEERVVDEPEGRIYGQLA